MRLIRIKDLSSIDKDLLMDTYEESNKENARALNLSLDQVKDRHLAYIEDEILKYKGNFLYVLEDKGLYRAALRLYRENSYYLIEALEVRADSRRLGYGKILYKKLLGSLPKGNKFIAKVGEKNHKSRAFHECLGFKIEDKSQGQISYIYQN